MMTIRAVTTESIHNSDQEKAPSLRPPQTLSITPKERTPPSHPPPQTHRRRSPPHRDVRAVAVVVAVTAPSSPSPRRLCCRRRCRRPQRPPHPLVREPRLLLPRHRGYRRVRDDHARHVSVRAEGRTGRTDCGSRCTGSWGRRPHTLPMEFPLYDITPARTVACNSAKVHLSHASHIRVSSSFKAGRVRF